MGQDLPPRLNDNYFGLTTTPRDPTGGWFGAVNCSSLTGKTFAGFACFTNTLGNDDVDGGKNSLYSSGKCS